MQQYKAGKADCPKGSSGFERGGENAFNTLDFLKLQNICQIENNQYNRK